MGELERIAAAAAAVRHMAGHSEHLGALAAQVSAATAAALADLDAVCVVRVLGGTALFRLLACRPRSVMLSGLGWLLLLGKEASGKGFVAVEEAQRRCLAALEASDKVCVAAAAALQVWVDFAFHGYFGELAREATRLASRAWSATTPQQRLYFFGGLAAAYVAWRVLRAVVAFVRRVSSAGRRALERVAAWQLRGLDAMTSCVGAVGSRAGAVGSRARRYLRRFGSAALFHGSFAVVAFAVWKVTCVIPRPYLVWSLEHTTMTIPAVASFIVLSMHAAAVAETERAAAAIAAAARANASGGWAGRLFRRSGAPPTSGSSSAASSPPASGPPREPPIQECRLWLCYWSFWPVVVAIDMGIANVPRFFPAFEEAYDAQWLLQRGLVVFSLWLQAWDGCCMLHGTLRYVANTSLPDTVLGLLAPGDLAQTVLAALRRFMPSWWIVSAVSPLLTRIWNNKYLAFIGAATALGGIFWWVRMAYGAAAMLSSGLTGALWVFAALDTANELDRRAEEQYPKKLSFWVLANLWSMLTTIPVAGSVLRIFTPIAFSMWLLAGELVFRRMVLPLLLRLVTTLRQIMKRLRSEVTARGKAVHSRHRHRLSGAGKDRSVTDRESDAQSKDAVLGDAAAAPSAAAAAPAETPPEVSAADAEPSTGEEALQQESQVQGEVGAGTGCSTPGVADGHREAECGGASSGVEADAEGACNSSADDDGPLADDTGGTGGEDAQDSSAGASGLERNGSTGDIASSAADGAQASDAPEPEESSPALCAGAGAKKKKELRRRAAKP